ncbi:hypothetical protein H1P_270001 [Hyella patelloides LEGE 07179]|uniref:Uncharacterized protein n=1 Tax=Hyella patelloides LEGE 07179 TaxID=945734 RepID=A0A563VSZ0_9CYAN|nr:hypothetical protein H1P_270001 [Hyella patelloides LEGE 07179]
MMIEVMTHKILLFVALGSKTGRIPIRGQCKLLRRPQKTAPPLSSKLLRTFYSLLQVN